MCQIPARLGRILEVTGMLFVPGLIVHVLSVSTLEDVGYRILFQDGHVLLYSEGATLDAAVVHDIKQGQ